MSENGPTAMFLVVKGAIWEDRYHAHGYPVSKFRLEN